MTEQHDDGLEAGAVREQAQVVLFAPIATPILRTVDPVQVAKLFKERDCNKIVSESKKAEVPTLNQHFTMRGSIDLC